MRKLFHYIPFAPLADCGAVLYLLGQAISSIFVSVFFGVAA
jgi:hypothetical protein